MSDINKSIKLLRYTIQELAASRDSNLSVTSSDQTCCQNAFDGHNIRLLTDLISQVLVQWWMVSILCKDLVSLFSLYIISCFVPTLMDSNIGLMHFLCLRLFVTNRGSFTMLLKISVQKVHFWLVYTWKTSFITIYKKIKMAKSYQVCYFLHYVLLSILSVQNFIYPVCDS